MLDIALRLVQLFLTTGSCEEAVSSLLRHYMKWITYLRKMSVLTIGVNNQHSFYAHLQAWFSCPLQLAYVQEAVHCLWS